MRRDSRRWQESTPSEHSHERAGLSAVRDLLPDAEPYRAWSNFTFTTADGRLYEVTWPLGIKTTDTRPRCAGGRPAEGTRRAADAILSGCQ